MKFYKVPILSQFHSLLVTRWLRLNDSITNRIKLYSFVSILWTTQGQSISRFNRTKYCYDSLRSSTKLWHTDCLEQSTDFERNGLSYKCM